MSSHWTVKRVIKSRTDLIKNPYLIWEKMICPIYTGEGGVRRVSSLRNYILKLIILYIYTGSWWGEWITNFSPISKSIQSRPNAHLWNAGFWLVDSVFVRWLASHRENDSSRSWKNQLRSAVTELQDNFWIFFRSFWYFSYSFIKTLISQIEKYQKV